MLSNSEMLDLIARVKYNHELHKALYRVGYKTIAGEEIGSYTTLEEVLEELKKGKKKDKEKALYLEGIKDALELIKL